MRRQRSSRPVKRRSKDLTILDRATNAVFMAVLVFSVGDFVSYGPIEACRHIVEVIASATSNGGAPSGSNWESATAD